MRKIVACLVALMICASMVLPAAAAPFTPSVTYTPCPSIVPVEDPDGNPALGEVLEDDVVIDYVYETCLVVTPVAEAETSTDIPEESRAILLDVYAKLNSCEMQIPYDKFNAGLDSSKMSVRDLFDATFMCGGATTIVDHPAMLEPDGVTFRITFDLGVAADEKIYTLTYIDGEWNPIVSTVNNGDGTVTCVFEKLCPIAFCVENQESSTPEKPPVQTGDPAGDQMIIWIVVGAVSLVALVALVVIYRTKLSKK